MPKKYIKYGKLPHFNQSVMYLTSLSKFARINNYKTLIMRFVNASAGVHSAENWVGKWTLYKNQRP